MPSLKEIQKTTLTALETERTSWQSHWTELQQFILPRRGRFLETDVNKGGKKNTNILDNTATLAARTLASGMMAGITSPARPWFRLAAPDPGMKELAPVKDWLSQVEALLREIFARSNIYGALHTSYAELGTFGSAPIYIQEDFEDVIRAFPFTIGSYYMGNDARLKVDTIYRKLPMTVVQIVSKFGIGNVTESTRQLYEKKQFHQWITVIHAIEPNLDRDVSKIDSINMPVRSNYWEENSSNELYLRKSGYEEFPVVAPRWDVLGGDIYGRSPGMDALGDVKQLQNEHRQKAKGIAKQIDPPMVGSSTLEGKPSNTLPGGVTYTDVTANGSGFTPAYQINFNLNDLKEDIYETQSRIKRAFYEDLFLMLAQSDRRQITAREVEEKHEEKLLMLGPVMERLNDELLDPLIDRTFNIAMRAGILPPTPPELEGVELKVEYISIMAQAQKLVGTTGLERLAGFAGQIASLDPGALDKIDSDQLIDEYADMLGTPPGVVNSDEEVEEIRRQRQAVEKRQQQLDMTQQVANVAKTAGEVNTKDGLLEDMLNNTPGTGGPLPGVPQ